MFALDGEVADGWLSPFMDVVRWDEAARAAAEGSRVEGSVIALFSGIEAGTWVGELDLGVEPRKSLLVLNLRERLLPDFSGAS